jgi:hypothetical protein
MLDDEVGYLTDPRLNKVYRLDLPGPSDPGPAGEGEWWRQWWVLAIAIAVALVVTVVVLRRRLSRYAAAEHDRAAARNRNRSTPTVDPADGEHSTLLGCSS